MNSRLGRSDCPRICHRWPFPREMRGTRRERLRAGLSLQPEHREVMAKSAKVGVTGHQCSLVFDGQGRSKAVDIVELVLGLDLDGTERSLGCGVHQADGQCMHSASFRSSFTLLAAALF